MIQRFFFPLAVVALLAGASCTNKTSSSQAPAAEEPTTKSQNDAAYARLQAANKELTDLMIEASQQGVDVTAYRKAQGEATYKALSNPVVAAELMEKAVADLRAEMSK